MFFPKTFAKSSGSEIVINTTPFKKDGSLTGLAIDNKKIISNPVETYCALCFFKKTDGWKAEIIDAQSEIDDLEKKYGTLPDIAAGGFWTILRNQEIYSFKDIKNYRTAAGICDNGKTLILLSAKNMSYMDCARIFLDEGAEAAMQFDGGRSAQLVINGKNQVRAFGRRKVPAVLGFIQ